MSIEGLSSSTARSLLLQRGDGTYDLVAWAEPPLWNTSTASELPQTANSSNEVTVKLSKLYSNVDIYDPLFSTSASSHLTKTSRFVIQVTDHPIIAHIGLPVPLTCAGHPSGKSDSITTAVKGMRAATVAECPAGGDVSTITTITTGQLCNDGISITGGTASSTADNGTPKCN